MLASARAGPHAISVLCAPVYTCLRQLVVAQLVRAGAPVLAQELPRVLSKRLTMSLDEAAKELQEVPRACTPAAATVLHDATQSCHSGAYRVPLLGDSSTSHTPSAAPLMPLPWTISPSVAYDHHHGWTVHRLACTAVSAVTSTVLGRRACRQPRTSGRSKSTWTLPPRQLEAPWSS